MPDRKRVQDVSYICQSKFEPRDRGVQVDKSGIGGGGQLGRLSLIIYHVESLLGATPSERRVRHVFPYIPSLASVTAYSIWIQVMPIRSCDEILL